MSVKSELDKIEKNLDINDDDGKIDIKINWRNDGLIEWDLEDGSSELITIEEYKKRGGILVQYGGDDAISDQS